MNREKELFKNTAIVGIGKISTQVITFFLLPVYTALLSTEEYGIVDLLNTLVMLLVPIISFQIEQAIFRYLVENRENLSEEKKIISTAIYTVIIQIIIYTMVFFIFSNFINNQYKEFLLINVIACTLSSVMLQITRGLGSNVKYSIGNFIIASSTIIFNILFIVIFKFGAYGMLMANFIANTLCVIYVFLVDKLYKYISFKEFKKVVLKKLWKFSIPLIPNTISWWIFNASDRIIVTSIMGSGANGILAAAQKFSNVYATIFGIVNVTWTETATLYVNDKDRDVFFSKMINIIMRLFIALCIGIIAFMPFVFPIMVNENFGEAYYQIPILILASCCNVMVSLLSAIYIAKKDTKAIAKSSYISAILNIIINIALIKFIGLYAASISTFAAYFIIMLNRYKDIKKYVSLKMDNKMLLIAGIIILLILIIYYINNFILNLIGVIIACIYAFFSNRKYIKIIIEFFRKKIVNKVAV